MIDQVVQEIDGRTLVLACFCHLMQALECFRFLFITEFCAIHSVVEHVDRFIQCFCIDGVGPHPIDTKALDETVDMLHNAVDRAKLGDKEKSKALKRLHQVAKAGENKGTPIDFLNDLIDHEWDHAEKNGGKTFMGNVVKGLSRHYP